MKTFCVNLDGWKRDVEIDDSIFDKYSDMATEAATIALESRYKSNKPQEISWFIVVSEKGYEDDPNKIIIILTEHILRNAGYHNDAETLKTNISDEIRKINGLE